MNIIIFRSMTANDVFPMDNAFIKLLTNISNNKVIYKDVSSLDDMIDKFLELKISDQSILQFIIQAHGTENSIIIGNDTIKTNSYLWTEFIGFLTSCLEPLLTINGSIFLHSCNVGKDNKNQKSLAKKISEILREHVIFAPNNKVHMYDLEVIENPYTLISYKVSDDKKRETNYDVVALYEGNYIKFNESIYV